jgi:hypothetical protein
MRPSAVTRTFKKNIHHNYIYFFCVVWVLNVSKIILIYDVTAHVEIP